MQQCIQLTGTNGRTLGHIYLTLSFQRAKDKYRAEGLKTLGTTLAIKTKQVPVRLTAAGISSGDHTVEETPVPIPNTAVKLSGPMIVPTSAKVGIARFYSQKPRRVQKTRAGFLHAPAIGCHSVAAFA